MVLQKKTKSNRRKKSKRKTRKWSIKKARMISKKKYKKLLTKKKKLSLNEKKQLNRALFVNYCKCIKKLKYNKKNKKGNEYPICNNSIYKNRGYSVPPKIKIKCRDYY